MLTLSASRHGGPIRGEAIWLTLAFSGLAHRATNDGPIRGNFATCDVMNHVISITESRDQHRVAVTKEAIFFFDGLFICLGHQLVASQRTNHH